MIIDGDLFESSNYARAALMSKDASAVNVCVNSGHRFEAKDLVELAYFLARKARKLDPDVDTDFYFGEQFNEQRYVYGYAVDGNFDKPLEMARGVARTVDEAAEAVLECVGPLDHTARWFIRDVIGNITVAAGGIEIVDDLFRLRVDPEYSVDVAA